jgi:hypothetical protein
MTEFEDIIILMVVMCAVSQFGRYLRIEGTSLHESIARPAKKPGLNSL